MFIPEINYAELFGVELSAKPEVADPGPTPEAEGENEPEVDEVEESPEDNADPDELIDDPGEGEDPDGDQGGQSKEDNARFAAARRKAEQERDAAIAKAQQEAQQQMDALVAGLGLKDPKTGEDIKTKQQYDRYLAAKAEEDREKLQKRAGISKEEWDGMIQNLPEVQKARAAQAEANAQRSRAALDADMKAVEQLDPTVKSLQDLQAREDFGEILKKVQGGLNLVDAFKVVTYEQQAQKRSAAAKQAAINNQRSKDHLRKTAERGSGGSYVPKDVQQMYRQMMPGITDAEISKHYNRKK